jgi:hypothetical protein
METVGTVVTVLENVMSKVADLETVELYVTDGIKLGVFFDWLRSADYFLHCQGVQDGHCNIFIGVRIIKEMLGSVASGTHCIINGAAFCTVINRSDVE